MSCFIQRMGHGTQRGSAWACVCMCTPLCVCAHVYMLYCREDDREGRESHDDEKINKQKKRNKCDYECTRSTRLRVRRQTVVSAW